MGRTLSLSLSFLRIFADMFIGNIISDGNLNVGPEFNVVNDVGLIDPLLPTIVIGMTKAKSIQPELDFLDRKMLNGFFWTFTMEENRKYYDLDLYNFVAHSYDTLMSNVTYFFVDFIQFNERKLKRIFNKMKNFDELVVFKHDDMVYAYAKGIVFGIDLSQVRYLGHDDKKLVKNLKQYASEYLHGKEPIQENSVYLEMLDNQIKYIPYLHYLQKIR